MSACQVKTETVIHCLQLRIYELDNLQIFGHYPKWFENAKDNHHSSNEEMVSTHWYLRVLYFILRAKLISVGDFGKQFYCTNHLQCSLCMEVPIKYIRLIGFVDY